MNLESIISRTLDNYTSKYDDLVSTLQDSLDVVQGNRKEMRAENSDNLNSAGSADASGLTETDKTALEDLD